MEKWEQAANTFIDTCGFKNEVEAVFLTGSYVYGDADAFSDIDLSIVLCDSVTWKERGSKRVDGYRIEYFANPMRQTIKYIDRSYADACLIDIRMIRSGIVIFNKNNAAEKMLDYCDKKLKEAFPAMNALNIKTGLYGLWDSLDEIHRAYTKQTPDMPMQFFRFIQDAFTLYSRYICSPVPGYHKLYRWLTDEKYAKRYGLTVYNDPSFLLTIRSAFDCTDYKAMLDKSDAVYAYIEGKMGRMNVDDFVLHGDCE